MRPAQGVVGDGELAGVIADHDRVAHQSLRAHRDPQRALAESSHQLAVEHVDGQAGQMHEPGLFAGEGFARMSAQSLADRRVQPGAPHGGERFLVDDIGLRTVAQQRQEVLARFRSSSSKGREAVAADLGGDVVAALMARAPCRRR